LDFDKSQSVNHEKTKKITAVEPIHLRVPVVNSIADGTQDVLIVLIHTDAEYRDR